jgi:hypothetical protein
VKQIPRAFLARNNPATIFVKRLIGQTIPFIERTFPKTEFISLRMIRFASLYQQERNIQTLRKTTASNYPFNPAILIRRTPEILTRGKPVHPLKKPIAPLS